MLLARRGRLRLKHLGSLDDLAQGGAIGQLLAEAAAESDLAPQVERDGPAGIGGCADTGCLPSR